jgi:PAS domain S-box-containing protein
MIDSRDIDSNNKKEMNIHGRKISQNEEAIKKYIQESKFFGLLIRSLPGVFYALDDNLRMYIWNDNLEKITGYGADELRNLNAFDFFDEKNRIIIQKIIEQISRDGKGETEATLITKDGDIPYFFAGGSAIIEGKRYTLGIALDISSLKEAQNSIIESEALYRTFAERITEGVALIRGDEIIFANNKFAAILGFSDSAECRGQKIMDFMSDDAKAYFKELFYKINNGLSDEHLFQTRWYKNNNNQEIWVEGKGDLIKWKGNRALLLTARDITETKLKEITMEEEAAYLRRENVALRSSIKDRYRFGDIIGKSAVMQEIYERILNAAATNANVIIYGESGTGKELVAKAIHQLSKRSQHRFVTVNCAAIPENLIETEFFGYKKGAFTGADIDKQGYLDIADGGILFLDEVGELGLNIQAKLLRAIDGGGYSPVGSNIVKHSDFRIIAATNKNLVEHTNRGLIREDFFYRIHIIPIQLPPLRQRKEDIPLLVEHFMNLNVANKNLLSIPAHVIEELQKYDWPGNIRELNNVIQRYLAVKKIEIVTLLRKQPGNEMINEQTSYNRLKIDERFNEHSEKAEDGEIMVTLSDYRNKSEKDAILDMLNKHRWNKSKTAEVLKISRKTLHRKMIYLGLISSLVIDSEV